MTIAPPHGRHAPQLTPSGQPRRDEPAGYFGVAGVDALLPEGLTYDTQVMVQGETGIGKSVLAAQFLYEGLMVGDTCVYIACDEPPNALRQRMAGFRLGTGAYERIGQLIVLDAYGRDLSTEARVVPEPTNLDEFFLHQKRTLAEALAAGRPVRLVVDSLSTLFATNLPTDIIEFNGHRLRYLRAQRIFTLDNFVSQALDERTLAGLSHSYPLILKLGYATTNGEQVRQLQLGKLKSGQFAVGQHPFTIDPRTGIVVRP